MGVDLKRSVVSQVLGEDDVSELTPALRDYMTNSAATGRRDARPVAAATEQSDVPGKPDAAAIPMGELSPLPTATTPYDKAHSLIANAPLPTIFFLDTGQLPRGFSNATLEAVWMTAPQKPGGSPVLVARFNGSVVTEVRIEGRNQLGLCDLVGRHLIHWVRQCPGTEPVDYDKHDGKGNGGYARAFVRNISFHEIK